MFPKQIILKTTSKNLINTIQNELSTLSNIRYNYFKFNGYHTINIKCFNYYDVFLDKTYETFYGSYLFLYTNISLILSKIIIEMYEQILLKREIKNNYFYLDNQSNHTILNIISSILDSNYPNETNKNFYMFRKKTILNELLKNFRHKNYIFLDSYINFSLCNYKKILLETVDKTVELYFLNNNNPGLIKLILMNLFFNN